MTIISNNHKLVFIHVPKCGGSSVEVAFQPHVRWGDFVVGSTEEGEVLHKRVFNRLYGVTKHSTAAEMKAVLGAQFDTMRVVAVVRQPLKVVESYYRFSKSVHEWIANFLMNRNPGLGPSAAKRHAVELVRAGKMDGDPRFDTLNLLDGTIKAGLLSESFGEFLRLTADARWSNYFAGYLCDSGGRLMATDILKLEDPAGIVQFFRTHVSPAFTLPHENVSEKADTTWPGDMRQRFLDLTRAEYQMLGYPAP